MPGTIAGELSQGWLILLVWVLGGVYALLGAISVAELGAAMPDAGGFYVYAKRAFGPGAGFAMGWADWLNNCAVVAYGAVAASEYLTALTGVGVQSEASPPMHAALAAGHLVTVPIDPSIADGLAGNIEAGSSTFPICQRELAEVVLVSEDAIAQAMRYLMAEHHVIVEGSGAVGVAALQSGSVTLTQGSRVAVILSGRNVTLDRLLSVL